jgi:hypothetical protein
MMGFFKKHKRRQPLYEHTLPAKPKDSPVDPELLEALHPDKMYPLHERIPRNTPIPVNEPGMGFKDVVRSMLDRDPNDF